MTLNIMECRGCGKSFWYAWKEALVIASGPCCFGHEVLDIDRFPTARAAAKEWPSWNERRLSALRAIWRKYGMGKKESQA